MKLLYLSPIPMNFSKMDGVQKKIMNQISAMAKDNNVDLIYSDANNVYLYNYANKEKKEICNFKNKFDLYKAVTCLSLKDYVGIYIRYPNSDPRLLKMLKILKKKNVKVVIEIPTYPYDKEGRESLRGRIVGCIDRYFRNHLYKYVDRIVTFSDDKIIFGIKTINTINGIDFSKINVDYTTCDMTREIKLIAVSAMYRVHGFERLIFGINDYYRMGGDRNVTLHLVGNGPENLKYQATVDKYNLHDYVIFHGMLYGEKLDDVYKCSAIGINSLAIHRQNLEKESTLKTREYAAKGLPILSSSYVDAFSENDNTTYIMNVSPDESAIDVQSIIDFVDCLYINQDIKTLRSRIRESAKKICDMEVVMKPVLDFFGEDIKQEEK